MFFDRIKWFSDFKTHHKNVTDNVNSALKFQSLKINFSKKTIDGNFAKSVQYENHEKVASSGTKDASEILDKYGNQILRMAYSYLHNMQDAEDMLQDTLIKYMQKAPEFESEEHEKAWLLRVCANLSKNRIDYNKVRNTDELNDELISEDKEDLAFVWDAVKSLPQKYKEVIHLFYQEGYQTKAIANILDMKETTVRSNLARGREQLKNILKEDYDFE
ncbi:MAG: sigma-70 family RNA polymerase sigma factor [Butyrivibrio sp.]|nr:sigma-70 family RNA polymerase sigma factor [Butyrivibrio sp.]